MEKTKYIDLHNHTRYSDGIYTEPEDIVRLAMLNGIDVLAITDHDNSLGYFEAKDLAESYGITLIPGAEITTPNYHLLALNFNPENIGIDHFLRDSKKIQEDKCKIRVDKLKGHGIPITFDMVLNAFPNARLGKYNVYVAMLDDSYCRKFVRQETPGLDFYKRFQYYFGKGGVTGGIGDFGIREEDAIKAVHEAGGVIGLAHPPKDIKSISELDRLIDLGIDFLEIQPNQRDRSYKVINYDFVKQFAEEKGLPISYGSDYHGATFCRPCLGHGENVLHEDLERILNKGFVKIGSQLEEVVF